MKIFLFCSGAVLISLAVAGCAVFKRERPEPVRPAESVDLGRYMGDWFVIANIPYWAEKNCYGSIERYKLTDEGTIDTTFLANRGSFDGKPVKASSIATVTNSETNAEWRIAFLGGLIRVDLVILHVSPDYRWAVVATPDRKLAWIFSRTSAMAENDYVKALAILESNGIATEKLELVPQKANNPSATETDD